MLFLQLGLFVSRSSRQSTTNLAQEKIPPFNPAAVIPPSLLFCLTYIFISCICSSTAVITSPALFSSVLPSSVLISHILLFPLAYSPLPSSLCSSYLHPLSCSAFFVLTSHSSLFFSSILQFFSTSVWATRGFVCNSEQGDGTGTGAGMGMDGAKQEEEWIGLGSERDRD